MKSAKNKVYVFVRHDVWGDIGDAMCNRFDGGHHPWCLRAKRTLDLDPAERAHVVVALQVNEECEGDGEL